MLELGAFCGNSLQLLPTHERKHSHPTAPVQLEKIKDFGRLVYKFTVF